MSAILAGHKGVLCRMDDIFIFGRDQGEHDPRLAAALRSIQAAVSPSMQTSACFRRRSSPPWVTSSTTEWGFGRLWKTAAVLQMTTPSNTTELRWFLGMVNQLGKFLPNLA